MPLVQNRFTCSVCDKKFKSNKGLRFHERKVHTRPCNDLSVTIPRVTNRNIVGDDYNFGNLTADKGCNIRVTRCLKTVKGKFPKEAQNSDLCNEIAKENDMEAVTINGDGSCQYSAILVGLEALGIAYVSHVEELRLLAYNEILANRSTYEPFLTENNGPFERYVAGVLGHQWGDEITLRALVAVLRINVQIYDFDLNGHYVQTIGNELAGPCIYLTLDNRNEGTAHYGALIHSRCMRSVTTEMESEKSNSSATGYCCSFCSRQYKTNRNFTRHVRRCEKIMSIGGYSSENVSFLNTPSINENIEAGEFQLNESDDSRSLDTNRQRVSDKTMKTRNLAVIRSSASDSDVTLNFDNEEEFKVPKTNSLKEKCQHCGLYFKNLRRHKKCKAVVDRSCSNVGEVAITSNDDVESDTSSLMDDESVHEPVKTLGADEILLQRNLRSSSRKTTYCQSFGNTRREHMKSNLCDDVNELKKKNKPWTKTEMQTDDPNYFLLKEYHDHLAKTLDNFSTERVTPEVLDVIDVKIREQRLSLVDDEASQTYRWSKSDEEKLKSLTAEAKNLKTPKWPWNAPDDSSQGKFNHSRFQHLVDKQLKFESLKCPECGITALLVGSDQIDNKLCMDCTEMSRKNKHIQKKYREAWTKVRPADKAPAVLRTVDGKLVVEKLPRLTPAEEAVIALVQPIITIQRNFVACRKYRQECLNLLHNPERTWCQILPRTDLKNRFVVIERRYKNSSTKYMVANPEKVKIWLRFLFANNPIYVRKRQNGMMEMSEEALQALESQSELASIDYDENLTDAESNIDDTELPPPSAELDAGLSKTELFGFEQYEHMYLKRQHALKLSENGMIEKISDQNPCRQTISQPYFCANECFPSLYPDGRSAPTDCAEHTLARYLLKKQTQFAQQTATDEKYEWNFANHSVHMMHQFARLTDLNVKSIVGWYINQRPERSNVPLQSLLDAFRETVNNGHSEFVDTRMQDLQGIMSKIRNSREKWYAERQGIEVMSRDMGDANLFFTLNCDPRAWPDVRELLFKLNEGFDKTMPPDYFEMNTQIFTDLLDKYGPQISVYMCKKLKLFIQAFLCDICRIPVKENGADDMHPVNNIDHGYFWSRSEWTETRGILHQHTICKLPFVLETSILARMIQNMRVVREELKFRNIKDYEKAWKIIKCGLLASRYLVLFADSISTCSFFIENMNGDQFDESKVIDLDAIRSKYVENYVKKDITRKTHPCMRKYDDAECDANENVEMANVAAVCCMHHCIQNICGGDETTGKCCRFQFPKNSLKYTVPMLLNISDSELECQILMRRTHPRVPNLQRYFLKYYRANHDFTVLVDSAHKMRYAAKYVSKSGKISVLLNEIIEHLEQKSNSSLVQPTIKHALTQLLLADCSQRAFMSKNELSYKVMDLPQIRRNFAEVRTVGHYPRAVLIEEKPDTENGFVELTDRTDYSAYSERCLPTTETKGNLTEDELKKMNLRNFAETIRFQWVLNKNSREVKAKKSATSRGKNITENSSNVASDCESDVNDADVMEDECDETTPSADDLNSSAKSRLNWRCRDRLTGHWIMSRKRTRSHVKPSTLLYTDLARNYVQSDDVKKFFDLPYEKRMQLKRAYQELVLYVPWHDEPDKTFLSEDVVRELSDESNDPDAGSRYSLKRLNEFFKVYMMKWEQGLIAPPGSEWHRDNQFSYTMYLANQHNRIVDDDRANADGVFVTRLESADDLEGTELDIQPRLTAPNDDESYPSASNFLPGDVLEQVEKQTPPTMADVYVAYPEHETWKAMKSSVSSSSDNLFMAKPPAPEIDLCDLTPMQKHAYDIIANGLEKVLYIYGKAGCGKTAVALHIANYFYGRCQCAAATGRAASNFFGPTIHGAFGWGTKFGSCNASSMSPAKKQKLQLFYRNTDVFIFDEINACSADMLSKIEETMEELFCAVNSKTGKRINKPFGGKTVVFLGDSAQLRPIRAAAIYDNCVNFSVLKYKSAGAKMYFKNAQKGQQIYRQYLMPKCVYLQRGQRNTGLLQKIMDNLREGTQTESDLDKLLYQRMKYPDYIAQRGVHYSNESASLFNFRQLWADCQLLGRHFYVCRALYHVDDGNDFVVRTLTAIPASEYSYAPDMLCLAEGCEVRLITNLDTSAGLVTNSTGRVVQIIYDSADAEALTKGQYPPAYCIVVHFPLFHGFLPQSSSDERYYPFTNRHLVPIYRRKFMLEKIPDSVRKLQARKLCYRDQFPLDLSGNLTAHRGQGQTWRNCTLSVNLGLESPQNKIPSDAASIAYVACTRISRLKDLFVSPIFPSVWLEMGKTDIDKKRRLHEQALRKSAEQFASSTGKYDECIVELKFKENFSTAAKEWQDVVERNDSVELQSSSMLMPAGELNLLKQSLRDEKLPLSLKAVESERYIGIDQGIKTFSMVAIDKRSNSLLKVVGVAQIDLEQAGIFRANGRFSVTDVLLKLEECSPLFDWIRCTSDHVTHAQLQPVERVVVLLEQISIENAYSKQLGKDLGIAVQRQFDLNSCVVRLSQPHVHRKNGPMFRLGEEIVECCHLEPPSYETLQTRVDRKRTINDNNGGRKKRTRTNDTQMDDVENSDDSVSANDAGSYSDNTYQSIRRQVQTEEYRKKKAMSSDVFQYFMNASQDQQLAMQVEIDSELQLKWRDRTDVVKYDDLGDALLHALDGSLCQGSRYRQLIPSSPTLHRNRTVVVVLLPDRAFWIVVECCLNKFTLQDLGEYKTYLTNRTFSASETVDAIVARFHPDLMKAMTEFDTSLDCLNSTGYIKVIVKQLKCYGRKDVTSIQAGSITNSTIKAVTKVADIACTNSTLTVSNSKKTGWLYSRTCKENGRRIDVRRSSGKHLNAILSCLQWMKANLADFVRDRPMRVDGKGRLKFLDALRRVAWSESTDDEQVFKLENIELNANAVRKLKFDSMRWSNAVKKTFADLILIGLDNNQQYISAISTNYRKERSTQKAKRSRTSKQVRSPDESERQEQEVIVSSAAKINICTCFSTTPCVANKHVRLSILSKPMSLDK